MPLVSCFSWNSGQGPAPIQPGLCWTSLEMWALLIAQKHAWHCHFYYMIIILTLAFPKKAPLVIHTAAVGQEKRARPSLGMENVIRSAQLLTVWEMDSTASKAKTPACKKLTWNMLISHKTNQEKLLWRKYTNLVGLTHWSKSTDTLTKYYSSRLEHQYSISRE